MFTEYMTTLPFCSSDYQDRCIPCPSNAKCLESEIKCDERYFFQDGQCLPLHILDAAEKSENETNENPSNYQRQDQFPKQIFLILAETFASISLIVFFIVSYYQARNSKNHKD